MEQHPVPQNVTTFQFRLIGDMTIKQFGYLIAGGILAVIAYKLPLPFIITWPLAGAFAFLGIGFAFIPVEERPMDVWVFSFFKSIYSPTQYIWSHDQAPQDAAPVAPPPVRPPGGTVPATTAAPAPAPHPAPQAPQPVPASKSALSGLFQPVPQVTPAPKPAAVAVAAKHASLFEQAAAWLFPKPAAAPNPTAPHAPTPSVTGHRPPAPAAPPPVADTRVDEAIRSKMVQLEETLRTLEERLSTKTMTEDRVLELQKQLTDVLAQKTKTEDELVALKRHISAPPPASPATTMPHPVAATPTQQEKPLTPGSRGAVNVITTQEGAMRAGLPKLTNVPNVITGLVRDDGGNFLPGILVTVTNNDGVPVRALKTNKLGQFAASTQLAPGTYFVEVEDPRERFTFSRVQITLNNTVVPVLEIIAKSEKALTREKLAQEIFGKPSL